MGFFARLAKVLLPLLLDWFYSKTIGLALAWSAKRKIDQEIRAKNAQVRAQLEVAVSPEERENAAENVRRNF